VYLDGRCQKHVAILRKSPQTRIPEDLLWQRNMTNFRNAARLGRPLREGDGRDIPDIPMAENHRFLGDFPAMFDETE